jgi:ACGX-repeat protein
MRRSDEFQFAHSAQGVLRAEMEPAAACGSACGSGDKPAEDPKPAACGSACGTGDKEEAPKPAACGSACGAGEKA